MLYTYTIYTYTIKTENLNYLKSMYGQFCMHTNTHNTHIQTFFKQSNKKLAYGQDRKKYVCLSCFNVLSLHTESCWVLLR